MEAKYFSSSTYATRYAFKRVNSFLLVRAAQMKRAAAMNCKGAETQARQKDQPNSPLTSSGSGSF